jgi:hypothetical protein
MDLSFVAGLLGLIIAALIFGVWFGWALGADERDGLKTTIRALRQQRRHEPPPQMGLPWGDQKVFQLSERR